MSQVFFLLAKFRYPTIETHINAVSIIVNIFFSINQQFQPIDKFSTGALLLKRENGQFDFFFLHCPLYNIYSKSYVGWKFSRIPKEF